MVCDVIFDVAVHHRLHWYPYHASTHARESLDQVESEWFVRIILLAFHTTPKSIDSLRRMFTSADSLSYHPTSDCFYKLSHNTK